MTEVFLNLLRRKLEYFLNHSIHQTFPKDYNECGFGRVLGGGITPKSYQKNHHGK